MAGKGPAPKDPALRMRRNKKATHSEVEMPAAAAPMASSDHELPVRACTACESIDLQGEGQAKKRGRKKRGRAKVVPVCATCGGSRILPWHPMTVAWWADLWNPATNPFCVKYLPIHIHGLGRLAGLVDDRARAETIKERIALDKEIRLQGAEYGLTPRGQMGLQWQVKTPPAGNAQPVPAAQQAASAQGGRPDPRKVLFMDPAAGGGERA